MKKDVRKMFFLKSHFFLFPKIFLVGIFLLSQLGALAQQKTVTGTITDRQTSDAMPGVNIVVRGTTLGTVSDVNGKYSFTVPDPNAVLVFSFIGYISQEI